MLSFLTHWWPWLLGGGSISIIAALVALRIFAPAALDIITALVLPSISAVGGIAGDALSGIRNNLKEGVPYIARNPRAIFTLAFACVIVAGLVYFPTKHVTAKKTWEAAHKDYRLVPKRKAKTAFHPLEAIRKSLGGY